MKIVNKLRGKKEVKTPTTYEDIGVLYPKNGNFGVNNNIAKPVKKKPVEMSDSEKRNKAMMRGYNPANKANLSVGGTGIKPGSEIR